MGLLLWILLDNSIADQNYLNNDSYRERTAVYKNYRDEKNIVMLGDSLTYRTNWAMVLNQASVSNMGIDNDITEWYVNRLNYVINLKPRICFIEGGINDLKKGISDEKIINNLKKITLFLKENNITPVLTSVLFVGQEHANAKKINESVNRLNTKIKKISIEENVHLIDLNPTLAMNGFLSSEYGLSDGIHLNEKAYTIWGREIIKILKYSKK